MATKLTALQPVSYSSDDKVRRIFSFMVADDQTQAMVEAPGYILRSELPLAVNGDFVVIEGNGYTTRLEITGSINGAAFDTVVNSSGAAVANPQIAINQTDVAALQALVTALQAVDNLTQAESDVIEAAQAVLDTAQDGRLTVNEGDIDALEALVTALQAIDNLTQAESDIIEAAQVVIDTAQDAVAAANRTDIDINAAAITALVAGQAAQDTAIAALQGLVDAGEAWVGGTVYAAGELFTHTVTQSTAVDANGNPVPAGPGLFTYAGGATAGGSATLAEIALWTPFVATPVAEVGVISRFDCYRDVTTGIEYGVTTKTIDDNVFVQEAINRADATDQPDISAGIPNEWAPCDYTEKLINEKTVALVQNDGTNVNSDTRYIFRPPVTGMYRIPHSVVTYTGATGAFLRIGTTDVSPDGSFDVFDGSGDRFVSGESREIFAYLEKGTSYFLTPCVGGSSTAVDFKVEFFVHCPVEKPSALEVNEFTNNLKPFHLVFAHEGDGGTFFTTFKNGLAVSYDNLLNASDVGDGRVNLSSGANSNFNRRASTVEAIEKVGDTFELIKPATPPFDGEFAKITSDPTALAHVADGTYRFYFNQDSYFFRDKVDANVASGNPENGFYFIERTHSGFKAEKGLVELYSSPEILNDFTKNEIDQLSLVGSDTFDLDAAPSNTVQIVNHPNSTTITGDAPTFSIAGAKRYFYSGTLTNGSATYTLVSSSGGGIVETFTRARVGGVWQQWIAIDPILLPFADDTAAGAGGIATGERYQTDGTGAAPLNVAGIVMVKQ